VERRAVTLGDLRPQGLLVTEGLEAGELVATAGVGELRDGQAVRLPPSHRDAEADPSTDRVAATR
jgi:hypothetical protein